MIVERKKVGKRERKKSEQAREERLHNEAPDFSIMNNHFPHFFFSFSVSESERMTSIQNPKRFFKSPMCYTCKNTNYAENTIRNECVL